MDEGLRFFPQGPLAVYNVLPGKAVGPGLRLLSRRPLAPIERSIYYRTKYASLVVTTGLKIFR